MAGDIAAGASRHIVVGNVAAVRGLVPKLVPIHIGAGCLAGNGDISAQIVGLDDLVAGAGARAAVDAAAGDRVGVDKWHSSRNGEGEDGGVHFEGDCNEKGAEERYADFVSRVEERSDAADEADAFWWTRRSIYSRHLHRCPNGDTRSSRVVCHPWTLLLPTAKNRIPTSILANLAK